MPLGVFGNMHQQSASGRGQPLASNETVRFEIRSDKATDPLTGTFDAIRKFPQQ
jgi:hypothetical protein